ncbi:hypothetical protein WA026_022262 [Henosepilachna vigintioctopunctata]|uniref:Uncharacterized protein n=1 Tax=Henosepilachna vigintioctopunctata TaxID=420089 RepID=A0AAW1UJE3_9CUCU
MLKLPPIDSNKKNNQKKKVHVKSDKKGALLNIDSQIFKNGRTWFELDKIANLCPQNRKYLLNTNCKEYMGCKTIYHEECLLPKIFDYDDITLRRSLYREHDPQERTLDKMKKINRKEEFLKKQWKDIESEELNFKAFVASYDRFVRLNVEKRITSQRKCGFFRQKNIEMKTFLTKVASLEGHGNATQLIIRYLSLKEAEEILREKNNESSVKLITHVGRMNKYRQEKLDMLEWLASKYSQEKDKFVAAKAVVAQHLEVLTAIQQETLFRLRKIVEVFNGVENFYNLVRHRHFDKRYIPLKHYDRQISYIDTSMECLSKIITRKVVEREKQSSIEEPPEVVYSLNIHRDEDKKEESSKTRLDEIMKSINALQKWTKNSLDESDESDLPRKRTQFAEIENDFKNLGLEAKISDMTKLTESIRKYTKYIESSYLDELRHPVSRNVSEQLSEPSVVKTSRNKHILHKSASGAKKGVKVNVLDTKSRKSSTNFKKSLQSSSINIELPYMRKQLIQKHLSRSKLSFKHLNYSKFFVNDDETITIFSDN